MLFRSEQIANGPKELEGKTEEDALIAYLQGLGTNRRAVQAAKTSASN